MSGHPAAADPAIGSLARALAGGPESPPAVDPDDARRTAEEILSDPAYAEPDQSLLDRALEWLAERFADVTPSVGGGPGGLLPWLFVLALVAGAVWLIVRALRTPRRRRAAASEPLEYGTESRRDAAEWLAEAARLAAVGDFRGALRCRHQALVARLVTDGVVDDVPGRTARELASLASGARPALGETVTTLTATFDDVWYGDVPAGAEDYAAFDRRCRSVEAGIEAGSTTPPVAASSTGAPA